MSTCKRLLVTLLALAALPQGAAAGLRQLNGEKTFCMELQLVNKEWKITGFNTRKICSGRAHMVSRETIDVDNGELKIPKEHDGKPITKIRARAFRGQVCNSLKSVKMPSIKEIGDSAFRGCTRLASVEMPSIKEIGKRAFYDCDKLVSVKMPSVTKIGDYAFNDCNSLTFVKMLSIKEIGEGAFGDCTNLASVEMPSVTKIGDSAFDGCTKLASVRMPSVTKIGDSAFAFTSLNSVHSTVTLIVKGNTFPKIVSGNTACDQPMFKDTC